MYGKLRFILRSTKLFTLIVLTTYTVTTFEFLCPHPSQRQFRAHAICNGTSESNYSCLYDIYQLIYIETCNQTVDFVVRGERYVISGGRLSTPCFSNRYQPFNFWSNVQTQCYYLKSSCDERGQVLYSLMSTMDDTACRCDYTHGFGFVTETNNPCYCIPSQEDCTCFKQNCPGNTKLSSDNKCKSSEINDNGGMCKAINLSSYSSSSVSSVTVADLGYSVTKANGSYAIETIIIIIIIIIIISITAVLVLCSRSNQSSTIKNNLHPRVPSIKFPQRDEIVCRHLLELVKPLCKSGNDLKILLDICFEESLLNNAEYRKIIQSGAQMNQKIINLVEKTLTKGSFEYLLKFLENHKHEEFKQIKMKIPPAISADFVPQPKSFFARKSEKIPMAWKAKKVKISVLMSESSMTLVFPERVTYCTKWFIQEFALYPIHNTSEFLPLTDDVHTRVEKSVISGGFIRVFEIYLCRETIIQCLPQNKSEVEIKLLIEPYDGTDNLMDTSHETHELHLSDILDRQKEVLVQEMQPMFLQKQFKIKGIELETEINNKRSRKDMAEELVTEIVQKNLSALFIEILTKNKEELPYLYNRLNSLIATFCKKQDIFGNIVSNMVEITESEIDLDSFQHRLIESEILTDQDFCSIRNENRIIELILRIRRTDERAIGYFIDALYDCYNNDLADRLLRIDDHCPEYENTETIMFTEDENILLEARIQLNIKGT